MIINRPLITKNVRCIYKFSFNDGSFYIGSTEDLQQRLCNYKRNFHTKVNVNKNISAKLLIHNEVTFEIIEIIPLNIPLKQVEQSYIRLNTFNPNLINSKRYWI